MKLITREWESQIGSFRTKMQKDILDKILEKKVLSDGVFKILSQRDKRNAIYFLQLLTIQKLAWNLSNYRCFS